MSTDMGDQSPMKAFIDGSSTEDVLLDNPEDVTTQAVLHNTYSFWFHRRGHQVNKAASYEETILKLGTFHTVEHFWRIYDHIIKPNEVKSSMDYHMFKDGIKPTWEDPVNRNGGKWMVRLKKGLTSMYWEDLVLAIIGEQFDVGHEICGAVVSIRNDNDIISVWNKTADNVEATNKIRDQLRRILKLPTSVAIEYKKHQESLTDNSSYRNPTIVWRPPANESNQNYNNNFNNRNNNFNRNNPSNEHNRHQGDRHQVGGFHGGNTGGNAGGQTHPTPMKVNSGAPPGVIRDQQPVKDGQSRPSRWDALAPKAEHQSTTQAPAQKAWRQPTAGASGWNSSGGQSSAWGSKSGNVPEVKLERETSYESNGGYVTAPEDEPNTHAAERSSSTDNASNDASQPIKGKSIGGWFKSKLAQGQAEANSTTTSEAAISSSPPTTSTAKPNPWRTVDQEANKAKVPESNATKEAPKGSWGRGAPVKKDS